MLLAWSEKVGKGNKPPEKLSLKAYESWHMDNKMKFELKELPQKFLERAFSMYFF